MFECSICLEISKENIECYSCSFSACNSCWKTFIVEKKDSICMNIECKKNFNRKFIFKNFDKDWILNIWEKIERKKYIENEKSLLPMTQFRLENKNNYDINESPFFKKCIEKDCRGYLDNNWKCSLCSSWICSECLCKKNSEEHICCKDMVETVLKLKENTKPCPKCFTPIYKIEGCDQMWCSQCHFPFHWETGLIQRNFHNPHFIDYQRRNNMDISRNQDDIECNRSIDDYDLIQSLFDKFSQKFKTKNTTNCICRIEGTNKIVSGTEHYIELWEIKENGYLVKIKNFFIKREWICGITTISGTKEFIISLKDELQVWKYENNTIYRKNILKDENMEGFLSCVYYIPEFKVLLCGGRSSYIYYWLKNDKGEFTYKGMKKQHNSHIFWISHIPNTNFIFSGGKDNNIVLWEFKYGILCHFKTINTEHNTIRNISKIPNCNRFISTCHKYLKIWEYTDNFEDIDNIQTFDCNTMYLMNIFNTNYYLTLGSNKNNITLWDCDKKGNFEKILSIMDKNTTNFTSLYIPEYNKIIIGNNYSELFSWDFDFTLLYSIDKISNIILQTQNLKKEEIVPYFYSPVDNENLRKSYLKNEINDEEFEKNIHLEYLKNEEKEEIRTILNLQIQGITDIIYRISMNNDKNMENYFLEIETLTEYCNSLLKENSELYYSSPLQIKYNPFDQFILVNI